MLRGLGSSLLHMSVRALTERPSAATSASICGGSGGTNLRWSRSVNTSLAPSSCSDGPLRHRPRGPAGDEDDFSVHRTHGPKRTPPRNSAGSTAAPNNASTAVATVRGASASWPPYSSASVVQPSSAASAFGVSRSSARYRRTRATTSVASGPAGSAVALAPALQPRVRLVEDRITPRPVRAVVPGQQAQSDRRRVDAVGAQSRHQYQVPAALAHLVAVPADHPGVHVVPGESPLPRDTFGVGGGELVVREDQVAAAALDVQAGADAAERDRRAFDVPTGPAGAERRRPAGLAGPLRPPHQRVEFVALARAVRVAAAFGEQPQHGVAVVAGLVAELRAWHRRGSRRRGTRRRRRRRPHRRPASSRRARRPRRWPRWRRRSRAAEATRSAAMSSRNSAVSRSASSRQSTPSRSARSNSGSSTSVTFCT